VALLFAKQRKQQNTASNGWQFSLLNFGSSKSHLPAGDIGFNPRFRD
jgi:hypothetical protein